ncbi:MAG: glycosyltransferase [Magnetovibrio sp.]|nr:glycosyltransferase [Magnetovibrio sp.]
MLDVSFVITFYNKSAFVQQVLNSVFAQQGLGECEYIFIDDGSTDDTVALLKQHSQSHDNVHIIEQENTGPAIATNRCIDAVTARYIKFVDGDDILHPRATLELLSALKETGVDVAYSLGEEVLTSSEEMNAPDLPLPDVPYQTLTTALQTVSRKSMFNLSCILVTTEAARAVGGCDPRVFIQGYSFALRILAHSNLAFVPKVLHWTPVDVADRASDLGGGAQVLHDLNFALAYFIADHPELPAKLKSKIVQRTTGRAWKWAKRVGGASILSKHFGRYIRAVLFPNFGNTSALIQSSCEAFRTTSNVRLP